MHHSLVHDLQPLCCITRKKAQLSSSHGTTPPLVPKASMVPKKARLCLSHNTTNFLSPVTTVQQVTRFAKSPQPTRYNTRTTTHPSQTAPNIKHARNNNNPTFLLLFHLHHTRSQTGFLLATPRRQRLPLPMVLVQVHAQRRNLRHNRNVDDGT